MCVCVSVCVRACVRACVRVCVKQLTFTQSIHSHIHPAGRLMNINDPIEACGHKGSREHSKITTETWNLKMTSP